MFVYMANNRKTGRLQLKNVYHKTSFYLPICLSVRLSVCLPAYLSVRLSGCLSVCLPAYLSAYWSVCPPIRLPVCPSIRLPVCLSIRLPVCPPACLSVHLPVFLQLTSLPASLSAACLPICPPVCLTKCPSVLFVCPSACLPVIIDDCLIKNHAHQFFISIACCSCGLSYLKISRKCHPQVANLKLRNTKKIRLLNCSWGPTFL